MKVVTLQQALSYIHDRDTLLIGGSGGGHAVPEALIVALEDYSQMSGGRIFWIKGMKRNLSGTIKPYWMMRTNHCAINPLDAYEI